MTTDSINLYEKLKPKIGEEEAKDLLAYIDKNAAAEGLTELRKEIGNLNVGLKEEIGAVKIDLGKEISGTKTELRTEVEKVRTDVEKVKSDVLRWMFLFWVEQLASIIGILFAFFRH